MNSFLCYTDNNFSWTWYGCLLVYQSLALNKKKKKVCCQCLLTKFSGVLLITWQMQKMPTIQRDDTNLRQQRENTNKVCFIKEHFKSNRICKFIFHHCLRPIYTETKGRLYFFWHIIHQRCITGTVAHWLLCQANSTFHFLLVFSHVT